MKSVRLIRFASSGCCAIDDSACASAFASPSAGAIDPIMMVNPATAIETAATIVTLSIVFSFACLLTIFPFLSRAAPDRGSDVDRGQRSEDIRLNLPDQEPESFHAQGYEYWRDTQQHADDHRSAHDVAEEPHRERERAGELADDVERKHQRGWLDVVAQIPASTLLRDAEDRDREEYGNRERRSHGERTGRRLVERQNRQQIRQRDEEKERTDEAQIPEVVPTEHLLHLLPNRPDDHFERVLPSGDLLARGEVA